MEFWSEEFEQQLIEKWRKKHARLYDISTKAFALIGCTLFNWVSCIADRQQQLSCFGEMSIATRRRN